MVILDACIVISFANAGYFAIVAELRAHPLCIGVRTRSEVIRDPARAALDAAIQSGRIAVESIDLSQPREQSALATFDSRPAFRNRGDAEVLALAVCRQYIVASDETAVRSTAAAELGSTSRVAGTLDFLRWAVHERRLPLSDASRVLSALDCGPALLSQLLRRGQSLSDLLGT